MTIPLQERLKHLIYKKDITEASAKFFSKQAEQVIEALGTTDNEEQNTCLEKQAILLKNRIVWERNELDKLNTEFLKISELMKIQGAFNKLKKDN